MRQFLVTIGGDAASTCSAAGFLTGRGSVYSSDCKGSVAGFAAGWKCHCGSDRRGSASCLTTGRETDCGAIRSCRRFRR